MLNRRATHLFRLKTDTAFQFRDTIFQVALPRLQGRTIEYAARYLGIPDFEYSFASQKVYVWRSTTNNPFMVPATTTTTGNVGGAAFSAISTTYIRDNTTLACELKLSTENGIVGRIEYDETTVPV